MKTFLLSFLFLSVISLSCKKESLESSSIKKSILVSEQSIASSKITKTNLGVTIEASLDEKTGEVKILSLKNSQPIVYVKYQSFKDVNGVFVANSSMNWAKYLNPFVVSNYSSIGLGVNHKLSLGVKTSNGSNFLFNFERRKK
jgi:hypothetical protein